MNSKSKSFYTPLKLFLISTAIVLMAHLCLEREDDNLIITTVIVWLMLSAIFWMSKKLIVRRSLTEESAMTHCPFCAEDIKSIAVVCRHCKADLDSPTMNALTIASIALAISVTCFHSCLALHYIDLGTTEITRKLDEIHSSVLSVSSSVSELER